MSLGRCCVVLTDSAQSNHAKKFGGIICPTRNLRGSTKGFMEAKHTPGPWELSEAEYKEGFGTYRRVEQVEQFGDVVASVCIRHTANHTLNACGDANARLIAAAPELLGALEAMSAEFDSGDVNDGEWAAIQKARAAIAKATGGAV